MGQTTPIHSSARQFFVGLDSHGHWVVRDAAGRTGGLFRDRKAAVHYACFEMQEQPSAVVFVPEHLALPLSGALPSIGLRERSRRSLRA